MRKQKQQSTELEPFEEENDSRIDLDKENQSYEYRMAQRVFGGRVGDTLRDHWYPYKTKTKRDPRSL